MIIARPIIKQAIRIVHIPFHLMKPNKPNIVMKCLCKDCIGINISPIPKAPTEPAQSGRK